MARRSSLTAALGEGGDAKWWEKAIEEEEENKTPWRALVTEDGLDYYMNIDTQGKKEQIIAHFYFYHKYLQCNCVILYMTHIAFQIFLVFLNFFSTSVKLY